MIFVMIVIMFMLIGSILVMLDFLLPGFLIPLVRMLMSYTGIIMMWSGVLVYIVRHMQTRAYYLSDLPNPNNVILFNIGNSGARLIKTKKAEMNTLLVHGQHRMRFKDMGNSINMGGHQIQVSSQTQFITFPLWALELVDKWKKRYEIRNKEELLKLEEYLKNIKTHDDLLNIPALKTVLADPKKKEELWKIPIEEIRLLSERLWDGTTRNIKSYMDFDESASAYDNEAIINKTLAHRAEQRNSLRSIGGIDIKIIITLMIILIMGGIAYQIFAGG